jgi:hypothetical protein
MDRMSRTSPQTVALTCHPSSPTEAVRSVTASARIAGAGKLAVRFSVEADMSRIALPALAAPQRRDELWRHTCFEIFAALPDGEAYVELNFSPSTEWAMYGFVGYRRGMAVVDVLRPPRVAVRPMPRGLTLEAVTYLDDLPSPPPGATLRAGLAAVIEETNGNLSYWALAHPSALPDFHHRLGFALQVGAPATGSDDVIATAVRTLPA